MLVVSILIGCYVSHTVFDFVLQLGQLFRVGGTASAHLRQVGVWVSLQLFPDPLQVIRQLSQARTLALHLAHPTIHIFHLFLNTQCCTPAPWSSPDSLLLNATSSPFSWASRRSPAPRMDAWWPTSLVMPSIWLDSWFSLCSQVVLAWPTSLAMKLTESLRPFRVRLTELMFTFSEGDLSLDGALRVLLGDTEQQVLQGAVQAVQLVRMWVQATSHLLLNLSTLLLHLGHTHACRHWGGGRAGGGAEEFPVYQLFLDAAQVSFTRLLTDSISVSSSGTTWPSSRAGAVALLSLLTATNTLSSRSSAFPPAWSWSRPDPRDHRQARPAHRSVPFRRTSMSTKRASMRVSTWMLWSVRAFCSCLWDSVRPWRTPRGWSVRRDKLFTCKNSSNTGPYQSV